MSLSDSLLYSPKPSAVSGHKYRQNLPTYNKSDFLPGEVMMLNIPCGRRGQFLNQRMSYLKFKVSNTGSTGFPISVDYSASSLIQRLEVYHSSNLLEQIAEYNVLHAMWLDMTGNTSSLQSSGSILEGTVGTTRSADPIPPGESRVYCIPLLSGIIGTLQNKYLPTGDMTGGDMRVELTLANAADGVVGAGAATTPNTYKITECELMLEYVELNSEAARMISQQNSSGYAISFDSFANFGSTIGSSSTNCNVLIPARYSSLKTLFTVFRDQSNIGKKLEKTISERYNFFGDAGQWYFSIGGKNVPTTPVKGNVEAFAELSKAIHVFGTIEHSSMVDYTDWTSASQSSYIAAVDLETVAHKSKLTESGINTLNANTHFIGQWTTTGIPDMRVDTFAHYDGILLIQNGVASVQF